MQSRIVMLIIIHMRICYMAHVSNLASKLSFLDENQKVLLVVSSHYYYVVFSTNDRLSPVCVCIFIYIFLKNLLLRFSSFLEQCHGMFLVFWKTKLFSD